MGLKRNKINFVGRSVSADWKGKKRCPPCQQHIRSFLFFTVKIKHHTVLITEILTYLMQILFVQGVSVNGCNLSFFFVLYSSTEVTEIYRSSSP